MMNISAIYGSPRKNGNTDLLLQSFVRGIRETGQEVNEVFLRNKKISPCIGCGGCEKTGNCVLQDDMQTIYPLLAKSKIIVLAAPVYFYNYNAQTKAMIDRCQAFWSAKYLLKKDLSLERGGKGKGIVLSVGGSKGKMNFDCVLMTARYFFDALDMELSHHLEYGRIDAKGEIAKHPTALDEAYNLGKTV